MKYNINPKNSIFSTYKTNVKILGYEIYVVQKLKIYTIILPSIIFIYIGKRAS